MFVAKKGLGKGLNALFDTEDIDKPIDLDSKNDIQTMKITSIEPNKNQPRKHFDKEKIEALSQSIKENGLIQPIIVTKSDNNMYKIVAGERRWRAAKKAGLKEIPVVIRKYTNEQIAEIALIENLQREDLNPVEEALGYSSLIEEFKMTQEEISQRIGKSRSAIANSLRLLSLDKEIQQLLIEGKISGGHARAVLSITDENLRHELSEKIINEALNVRQAEALAKKMQKQKKEKKDKSDTDVYAIELQQLQNRIASNLGTKVKISGNSKKGRIEIEYYGNDDLDRILDLLNLKED